MQRWIPGIVSSILVAFATLVSTSPARAVEVAFTGQPGAFVATRASEQWVGVASGLVGALENTEQLNDPASVTSLQKAGVDAVPNPSCISPCTGVTTEATASFDAGGLRLSAYSHSYGNFDQVITSAMPPVHQPAYQDGNIVRAEAAAGVFDILTVTRPVTIDVQGHIAGECQFTSASMSYLYVDDLGPIFFGVGRVDALLRVTLSSDSLFFRQDLVTTQFAAGFGTTVPVDEDFGATSQVLAPGEYKLSADLRTNARIGLVSNVNLAEQDMRSDFGHTMAFRLVADDPSAVTSASGRLTFTAAPEPSVGALEAVAALALLLRARAVRTGAVSRRSR